MIPLSVFLIIYAVIFACLIIFSLINFYHLLRYGLNRGFASMIIYLYLATVIINIFFTWNVLRATNWQNAILLFETQPTVEQQNLFYAP